MRRRGSRGIRHAAQLMGRLRPPVPQSLRGVQTRAPPTPGGASWECASWVSLTRIFPVFLFVPWLLCLLCWLHLVSETVKLLSSQSTLLFPQGISSLSGISVTTDLAKKISPYFLYFLSVITCHIFLAQIVAPGRLGAVFSLFVLFCFANCYTPVPGI